MIAEPGSDPRSPAVRQAAQQALADAEAAEAEASTAVSDARELLALGRATRGDVLRAQHRLAAQQELTAQAGAAIRAIDRAANELRSAEQADRERRRVERVDVLRLERAWLEREVAEFLAGIEARAQELDAAVVSWNQEAAPTRTGAGGYQAGHLPPLSASSVPWGRFLDGLSILRKNYRGLT